MTKGNRPLDPDRIAACLEEAIEISKRQERERLRRVGRIGTGGIAKTGGSKSVGRGALLPSASRLARRLVAAWERRLKRPAPAMRRTEK